MAIDAIIVGSGPNGLSAAITLAQAGKSVRVYEADATIGGGTRSAQLTQPGFVHDVCAGIHSMALASPFLKTLPLAAHGLEFIQPTAPFAHPLDDGTAVVVRRSIEDTARDLGADGGPYRRAVEPFVRRSDALMDAILGPIGLRHPFVMASFAPQAIRSARAFASGHFANARTRAMFAGIAAHSLVPLDKVATAGYGLALAIAAHAVGWPLVRGGSQRLADALATHLRSLGGEIVSNTRIDSLDALSESTTVLLDVTPRQFLRIAGPRLRGLYAKRLRRYRYGPGVYKMDWALREPVPWRAAECRTAGTVHLGGSFDEIAAGEADAWNGRHAERPYMIVVQPSVFDETRAPPGRHTLWAYCHVPHGSTVDMRERMERQIERFAPGFRDCIIASNGMSTADLERRNANLVGGDIAGGAADFAQVYMRPIASLNPYATPLRGVYLCSASTPPGIGVHGMCGHYAARAALRHLK